MLELYTCFDRKQVHRNTKIIEVFSLYTEVKKLNNFLILVLLVTISGLLFTIGL